MKLIRLRMARCCRFMAARGLDFGNVMIGLANRLEGNKSRRSPVRGVGA